MKRVMSGLAMLTLSTAAVQAGGIDKSGMGIGGLFAEGTVAELSFGSVAPSVSGNDVALFGGGSSGNVAGSFTQYSLSVKTDLNAHVSAMVMMDQPFGADILYGAGSAALGGTKAEAMASGLTGVLRYKMDNGFSVHGGLRLDTSSANIDLRGAAYAGVNGYSVKLDQDIAAGYVMGVAYEKPDIALRVALTYNSKIKHSFGTTETLSGAVIGIADTEVNTPQSVNLDVQTGIAANTLLFGSIRWVDWSEFKLEPATFVGLTGDGLIGLDDTTTFTVGVGRKINDNWSAAASISYEAKDSDPLVSPLAPTNGLIGITLAGIYTAGNMKVTAGVNYTKVGDAQPQTADTARANFSGNSAVGVGVKVAFTF
jgi:long-chain fatty acid transport protein